MTEIVTKKEKTFEYYMDLPSEVRIFVIDEQQPDDRCRFTRCSKLCNKEAKASKNYIYKLRFLTPRFGRYTIEVNYNELHGYKLYYENMLREKTVSYFSWDHRSLWRTQLDSSKDLFQYAIEKFKNLLQTYQNRVKRLELEASLMDIETWRNIDFEVDSLKDLRDLFVCGPVDVNHLLSKTRKPLEKLNVTRDRDYTLLEKSTRLVNFEKIYNVQQLEWPSLEISSSQFLQLSSYEASINIGKLTTEDIFNFIRSWQNGTLGRKIGFYTFYLKDSNFNIQELLRRLGVANHGEKQINIENFNKDVRSAILWISEYMCFIT